MVVECFILSQPIAVTACEKSQICTSWPAGALNTGYFKHFREQKTVKKISYLFGFSASTQTCGIVKNKKSPERCNNIPGSYSSLWKQFIQNENGQSTTGITAPAALKQFFQVINHFLPKQNFTHGGLIEVYLSKNTLVITVKYPIGIGI